VVVTIDLGDDQLEVVLDGDLSVVDATRYRLLNPDWRLAAYVRNNDNVRIEKNEEVIQTMQPAGDISSPRNQSAGDTGLGARGQTLHDYSIGIGLFVLAVAATLTAMFGLVDPLSVGVTSEDVSQSERISESVVANHSTARQPNELRADRIEATLDRSPDQLKSRWGVESSTNLNVSVETLDGSAVASHGGTKLAVGSTPDQRETGTAARVVTFDESVCDPACRLVVRVW